MIKGIYQRPRNLLASLPVLLLVACSGAKFQVASVTNANMDLTGFRTIAYAGARDAPLGFERTEIRPESIETIRTTIRAELGERLGYEITQDPNTADLVLMGGVGRREVQQEKGATFTYQGAGPISGETVNYNDFEETISEGAMVLDVFERATGQQVWHGVIRVEVNPNAKGPVDQKKLAKSLVDLFKTFPPAASAKD